MAIGIYFKTSDHYTLVERPYVKRNGVWTPVMETWVKATDGHWKMAQEYDVLPPSPPEITLNIHEEFATVKGVEQLSARWIRVGTRLPGTGNDDDLKMIRILTEFPKDSGKPPTNPLGGTYIEGVDDSYPNEPWSDFRYNKYGVHKDTSEYIYKQYPRNASEGVKLTEGKRYYFTGWSQDANGNWSASTATHIDVPKATVNQTNIMVKEARMQPNNSGSFTKTGFAAGDLKQQGSPRSQGHYFYGAQLVDSIGAQGPPTIRSAQIWIQRMDEIGAANANIYLFWTDYGSPSALPAAPTELTTHGRALVGTLAKGQGKWFDLPSGWHDNLKSDVRGIGLDNKDPARATAFPEDYSEVASTASNLKCGEVHIVWQEAL